MTRTRWAALAFAFLPGLGIAQIPDSRALLAAQRAAMAPLAYMDGVWRGTASTLRPSGEKHTITHTERVGPFLDGAIKVIEGRGYDARGEVTFNALGIMSYDPERKTYAMRSYAMGRAGDFPVTLKADGFTWEIPQGPNARILYTATVTKDIWHEVGDRVVAGREPMRFFEMTLKRMGNSEWPAADPVPPK